MLRALQHCHGRASPVKQENKKVDKGKDGQRGLQTQLADVTKRWTTVAPTQMSIIFPINVQVESKYQLLLELPSTHLGTEVRGSHFAEEEGCQHRTKQPDVL